MVQEEFEEKKKMIEEFVGSKGYRSMSVKEMAMVLQVPSRDKKDFREVSDALAQDYGIATRPGAHCAPRMHRALGTERQGAVRFSFGWFNTEHEIDTAIHAVKELAE